METVIKALRSRTVWTIIIMFIIGGTEAVTGLIPESVTAPVLFVLGLLATYFKLSPSQRY